MTCRDCGEVMSTDELVDYKLRNMQPQAKPGDPGGHEGICNSCMDARLEEGETYDDLIYEFCG